MFTSIVWGTDGSSSADHALPLVIDLAREPGALVTVVHVDEHFSGRAAQYPVLADEPELRGKVHRQLEQLHAAGIEAELRIVEHRGKHPADAIAEVAGQVAADVIVVGTRGHGRFAGALVGSVAQQLPHVASCPVLVVPVHALVREHA
jgi:nucleotide-binding universal stress UspA family protein